jgi:hypothetical protein
VEPFKGNAPASDTDVQAFEANSGINLPLEYLLFLKRKNGGRGFVGANYLEMYPIEKLIEYNHYYDVDEYAPELFLFGSNGGREGFAFDRRPPIWPIVMVPFVPLDIREAIPVAPTFAAFFDTLSSRDFAALK